MNWLHYILETNIYLSVFYLLYFLVFQRETHYRLNRVYLLIACALAYVIPVVQIGALKTYGEGSQVVTVIVNNAFNANSAASSTSISLRDVILYAYIAGAAITAAVLIVKLFRLSSLMRYKKSLFDNKYKLVPLEGSNTAFSFFNYVFIGTNARGTDTIIRHELVHVKQKHSMDIIFLELIRIPCWFNPFVYLLQRSLKTLHEYIADEHTAASENGALAYSSFLVNNAYGISGSSITHSFFNYNLLKRRIIMLNHKRSGKLAKLKYLLALPVCVGLLCTSTLAFSKNYGLITLLPGKTMLEPTTSPKAIFGNARAIIPGTANPVARKKSYLHSNKLNPVIKKDTTKKPPPPPIPPKKPKKPILLLLKPDQPVPAQPDVAKPDDSLPKPPRLILADVKQPRQVLPPPPPPFMPANKLAGLSKYIAKHVRYPAVAFNNKVMGSVILQFDVDNSHHITNVKILKGIGSGCDEEAQRVLKMYPEKVEINSGTYKLAVTFYLEGLTSPKTASEYMAKDGSFEGEIVITGFPAK